MLSKRSSIETLSEILLFIQISFLMLTSISAFVKVPAGTLTKAEIEL